MDSDKEVAVFLSVIGGKTYTLLRNLTAPVKPSEKTLAALKAVLKKHFEPTTIVIAERYYFHRRNQAEGESIAEYIAELRRLSIKCEFGDYLEQALRDRLVCGLRSKDIQEELLTKSDLTLTRAQEIAEGMEAASRNTQQLNVQHSTPIHKSSLAGNRCYRCGKTNHSPDQCKHKLSTCYACQKKGHLAEVCRSKGNKQGLKCQSQGSGRCRSRGRSHNNRLVSVADQSPEHHDTELSLNKIVRSSAHPIVVDLLINDMKVSMEVDTGAAVTIISERVWKQQFPQLKLQESKVLLKTYTGEPIPVRGETPVRVRYQDQECSLTLTVVRGNGPSLLGRNWLEVLRLDWKTIGLARAFSRQSQVDALLKEYNDVFQVGLGSMSHFKACLHVKEGSMPVFHRPRPVPFAIREAIERELERLENDGIVERVDTSEWATPIVPDPKRNGCIRICGDYRITINPHLQVDQYPLPKPDDLFASLAGGQHFTVIDLSHAFQQMPLDEQSREYVTINTHQGLYRYLRMPFGITPAPAIFQRTMDTILQDIPHVVCYQDDVLITGSNTDAHLKNLEEVLKRFRRRGLRANKAKCTFFQDSVMFLGHKVDAKGLHTTSEKVEAIKLAPRPKDQSQLKSFLGLLHYYGKFLPNLAALLHPLNRLLQKGSKWNWSSDCERAFQQAKEKLTSAPVLAHYDPKLPLRLAGDASAYGISLVPRLSNDVGAGKRAW